MALEFFSSSVADAEVTLNPSTSSKKDISKHFNDVISKAGLSSSIEKLSGDSNYAYDGAIYGASGNNRLKVTNLMGYTGDTGIIYPYCNISKTITAQIVKDDDRKIFILMPKDYYNGKNIMIEGNSFGSASGDYWISAFFYLIIINGTLIGSARKNKDTGSNGELLYNSAGSFFNSTAFTTKSPLISNKSNVIAPVYPNTAHGSFNVPSNSKGFVPYLYFTLSGHWLPSQVKVTDGKQTFTSIGNGMYIIDSSQEQTLSDLNPREIEVVS